MRNTKPVPYYYNPPVNLYDGRGGSQHERQCVDTARAADIAVNQLEGNVVLAEQIIKDACWLDMLSRTAAQSGCDDLTMQGIAQARQNHLMAGYYAQQRLNQYYSAYWEERR